MEEKELDKLFESLAVVEEQRAVLGDAVDATIAQIHDRIWSEVPAPTEDEQKIATSWQSLVQTSEELGIETPSPTPEVAAAVAATERFNTVLSRLGSSGMSKATEVETEPPASGSVQPEPTQGAPEPAPKPPKPRKPRTKAAPKVAPTEPKAGAPETTEASTPAPKEQLHKDAVVVDITDERVIKLGDKIIRPQPANLDLHKQVVADISEALQEAAGEPLSISVFLKAKVGASARKTSLVHQGKSEPDPGIDYAYAKKYQGVFYKMVEKLGEMGAVEHTKGIFGKIDDVLKIESGKLTLRAPVIVVGEAPDKKPYNVTVNLYEQSIDNGKGRRELFDKEPQHFKRIAKALGSIASKTLVEQSKFTRSKIGEWMDGDDYDKDTLTKLSFDLQSVISSFDEAFPLSSHGVRGGGYYAWQPEATAEIIDGWPEKPNFEDAVHVRLGTDGVMVTIDGKEYSLVDYTSSIVTMSYVNIDIAELTGQNKRIFELLALMGPEDRLSLQDVLPFVKTPGTNGEAVNALSTRIRNLMKKLNNLSDVEIVNWQRQQGIQLDVNRRIIISEDPELSTTLDKITVEPTLVSTGSETPASPVTTEDVPAAPESELDPDGPVGKRLSAEEIVASMHANLSENDKKIIRGRLVQHGSFEYPHTLEEAAYMLRLLADPQVMAEARESRADFRHYDAFKTFTSEALYACYARSLSWGNFEDLISAVTADIANNPYTSDIRVLSKTFDDATDVLLKTAHDTSKTDQLSIRNKEFLESATTSLIEGWVPAPTNPIQAVGLLDIFRKNRAAISDGKTQAEFSSLINRLHQSVAQQLGQDNLSTLVDSRLPRPNGGRRGRVVQVSRGEEAELSRTDSRRYPDRKHQGKRRQPRRR